MEAAPQTDWIRISEAVKIATQRFGSKAVASRQMIIAFKLGKIRNGGILCLEDNENPMYKDVAYRQIHVHTDDFFKWLNERAPAH